MNHLEEAKKFQEQMHDNSDRDYELAGILHALIAIAEQFTRQNNILSIVSESISNADLEILFKDSEFYEEDK